MSLENRFQFPEQYPMRLVNQGAFLASFTIIDTETGLEYRDVRLIRGKNGEFVSSPYREYEDKKKQTQRVDFWRPAYDTESKSRNPKGEAWTKALTRVALGFYEHMMAESGASAPAQNTTRTAQTRGGRGPVSRPTANEDSGAKKNGDGLPF